MYSSRILSVVAGLASLAYVAFACAPETSVTVLDEQGETIQLVVVDTVVTAAPALEFGREGLSLLVGQSVALSVTVINALGFPVAADSLAWFVTDESILQVNGSGTVTALSPGSASVIAVETAQGLSSSLLVVVSDTTTVSPPPPAGSWSFQDTFESADMSSSGVSAGLAWSRNNRTSVVRDDGCAVYNNGPIENCGQSDNWENGPGVPGRHALRFRYPEQINQAEQRFTLSEPQPELWIRYWLRVPVNFVHWNRASAANNNKLFAIWMDGYQANGDGSTVTWEFWPSANGSEATFYEAPGGFQPGRGHQQRTEFIVTDRDRGRWMELILHVRAATDQDSNDGLIETFQRWEGEADFRTIHRLTSADIGPAAGGPQGWQAGYIMGWANGYYLESTEWLVDDFSLFSFDPR